MIRLAPEEVEIALPGALFGGNPRGFIDHLGLHGRSLGDNRWAVWPNNAKAFVTHHGLADETEFDNRFDHLDPVPITGAHMDDPQSVERFELDSQLAERMTGKPDITALSIASRQTS